MPCCRRGANRGHSRALIPTRESGAHTGQIDPVGFAEPFEEPLSDGSGPPPEYPCRRKIDNVKRVVGAKQHIAVVEIGQSHTASVQFIENRTEPIEECVIEPGSSAFPQRLGVDPTGGQGVRSEATEIRWQGIDDSRFLVGSRLTANQPPTERVPNHRASRLIRLDSHPLAFQLKEENIGLGSVAAPDPANRLGSRD